MNKNLFRIWHRRIGIISALMLLWLALSGFVINHGDAFEINKTKLNIAWLNKIYGMDQTIVIPPAFFISNNYFFCFQGNLYANLEPLAMCDSDLASAAVLNPESKSPQLILLNENELIILDEAYTMVDRINVSLFEKQFSGLLAVEEKLILVEKESSHLWHLNLQDLKLEAFEKLSGIQITSQTETTNSFSELDPISLPADLVEQLSFSGLDLERVLLDAHSGKIFGWLGVLIVDCCVRNQWPVDFF
jgi:hypothetical protein